MNYTWTMLLLNTSKEENNKQPPDATPYTDTPDALSGAAGARGEADLGEPVGSGCEPKPVPLVQRPMCARGRALRERRSRQTLHQAATLRRHASSSGSQEPCGPVQCRQCREGMAPLTGACAMPESGACHAQVPSLHLLFPHASIPSCRTKLHHQEVRKQGLRSVAGGKGKHVQVKSHHLRNFGCCLKCQAVTLAYRDITIVQCCCHL